MAFHSYTRLIQKLFNAYWFGPPSRVTGTSPWPSVDHLVSRLPTPTQRPIQARSHCGCARPRAYPRRRRQLVGSLCKRHAVTRTRRAPTACGRMVSGSVSTSSAECFSPFPHGTGTLSVSRECLALPDGPGGFRRDYTCPALLRMPRTGDKGFGYGAITLCGAAFQAASPRLRPAASAVLQPRGRPKTTPVWAPPLSLATTRGIIGLFSLPAGTKMFQFPAFASPTERGIPAKPVGCPIRRPADQRPLAPTRGLSQLVTSFIASASQGIRHAPSNYFLATRPKGGRRSTCVLACADCQRSIAGTKHGGAGKGGGMPPFPRKEGHGQRGEGRSPERRCSSRTFRYGYLVTT